MKRFTMTTLCKLKPGDTFYKDGDKLEIVYTVADIPNAHAGMMLVKKGELKFTDMLPKRQAVIFLKHKT